MQSVDGHNKGPSMIENIIAETSQGNVRRIPWHRTLALAFGSLGAVYGDIGTSPLYVMNSIQIPHATPTRNDIYGCCSLIFWLFVILVFFKYTLIVLTFGPNDGEGGQIAIYTKIARHLRYGVRGPGVHVPGSEGLSDLEMLHRTNTLMSEDQEQRTWKQNPKVVRFVSLLSLALGFVGCALIMSDGLLTPTTTALTAVGGIQLAVPSLTQIVGISEAILVFLFLIQYLGSGKLSMLFAPIMFVWLVSLAVSGIYNIARYDPGVFRSLSPYYAIRLLRGSGIDALGGAMLAITGTEAMFADLGHFGKVPIQLGISFTLICLLLTYLGQGAYLVKYPDQFANVFYSSLPGGVGNGFYWFMFVLAILCTIVASQALILGVFSILQQLINLDCFPKLKIIRFSNSKGRVFIPLANLLLFAGVWGATAAFKNSNNVTAAYGLGISLDFVVTSSLLSICLIFAENVNPLIVVGYICIFVPLEMCLVISNMKKVPHGAWFPLMMCGVFTSFFFFWWYFRCKTVATQIKSRVRIRHLFPELRETSDEAEVTLFPSCVALTDAAGNQLMAPLNGADTRKIAIIYSDTQSQDMASPNTVPGVYASLVRNFCSLPSIVIFCTIKSSGVPVVDIEDKVLVVPTKVKGHYKAVVRFGFAEDTRITGPLLSAMQSQLSYESGDVKLKSWQLIHIFEKNVVRSTLRPQTRNVFKLAGHFVRKCLIEQVFHPINAAYQNDDRVVVEQNSPESKLFVGGVLRI
nr:Hak1 [Starmerella bombicola]